ncbi:MAG: carbamoyltransferase HypF [Planctomycetota bacterium]|nr:MAG: carbamoyltransferase HypF [Planctomycetota bacterium]
MPSDVSQLQERLVGVRARRLLLTGRVQGVGLRPAIARLAADLGLCGSVANCSDGVEVRIEGSPAAVEAFQRRLPERLPAGAELAAVTAEEVVPRGTAGFVIERGSTDGPLATSVPPDRAVCETCLSEVRDATDRRFGYAFTSCTDCGPRYSIIVRMPYERADTTMQGFTLCPRCAEEYTTPGDRRFHAQTNACPTCGPRVWLENAEGAVAAGTEAVAQAARAIRNGRIVALRGIGGYQLLCDATDDVAVRRLRERKGRPAKPLAVMVDGPRSAERLAELDERARRVLCGLANPIVLVPARPAAPLAASVHPGVRDIGLLMPTTPLHALLLKSCGRPLVCTSGNREGEPLVSEVAAARRKLARVCDLWLHHDRPIAHPIDDSVVRMIGDRAVTLRLARGLAPLPLDGATALIAEGRSAGPVVALGGQMKSAVAWWNGAQAVLGPHLGELDVLPVRERFERHLEAMHELYRFRAERLVHDAHPEYFTSLWAARRSDVVRRAVQHHHAHVVAGMLEHGWLDREVFGVAFDGTGYGVDGTIWGGEFLLCTVAGFRRVGHVRGFRLPGGEAAVREPWRVAVAMLAEVTGAEDAAEWLSRRWADVDPRRFDGVRRVAAVGAFAPRCTSAGRLFDAVAALTLGIDRVDFEGQAAMLLESVADEDAAGRYAFAVRPCRWHAGRDCLELDWAPVLAGVLGDCRRGVHPGAIAMRFHRAVAGAIADVANRFRGTPVVLSGGVFQNRLLTECVIEAFGDAPSLGRPGVIPPNDGGLAAGQLMVALSAAEVWRCRGAWSSGSIGIRCLRRRKSNSTVCGGWWR